MKLSASIAILLCLLFSCTAGPVYIAKTQQEGIRSAYQDSTLSALSNRNQETLREIFGRYQLAGVDVYPDGIGFTALSSQAGRTLYYLLVDVRPRGIAFGEGQTKPQERLSEVYFHHVERNLRLMKPLDLQNSGVDGLAFAVHWPVRDYSQCDTHGGFLEYVMIYLPKEDFLAYCQGSETFSEAVDRGEVFTSLDRKGAQAIRLTQE